jgi:hypothetical protein
MPLYIINYDKTAWQTLDALYKKLLYTFENLNPHAFGVLFISFK